MLVLIFRFSRVHILMGAGGPGKIVGCCINARCLKDEINWRYEESKK